MRTIEAALVLTNERYEVDMNLKLKGKFCTLKKKKSRENFKFWNVKLLYYIMNVKLKLCAF